MTSTGSFLCLYVAVVPFFNVDSSITGTLLFSTGSSFTSVIYFLKLKSNSFGIFTTSIIGCASEFEFEAYTVNIVFSSFTPFLALLFAVSIR